jgi:hypothetical protein
MDSANSMLSGDCSPLRQRRWRQHLLEIYRRSQEGPLTRGRRVLLLVLVIWVFNVFDLNFTLLAHRIGGFEEANPLAAAFLPSEEALVIYKFAMILPPTLIFLFFRRRLLTEIGCWTLCAAHVALSFMWVVYYSALR